MKVACLTRFIPADSWQKIGCWVKTLFTQHPKDTGETYLQHLWFTVTISLQLFFAATTLLLHGILPFIFTRTTSAQIEKLYLIMKSRIPQSRRETLDSEYEI